MATAQSPESGGKASLLEDFVDILTSPAQVFGRRMGSNPVLLMFLLTVACAALFFVSKGVLQPAMDADYARMTAKVMAKNPEVTAAQMETAKGMQDKFAVIGIVIILPIAMLLTGLVLWLMGKLVGSVQKFGDAVMVATYAFIPRVLSFIVVGVIAMMTDPAKMVSMLSPTLSLARFMDPDTASPVLLQLAGRIDVFVIWQTVLLAIGLSVTGKISRAQAYGLVVIVWLLGAAPQLIGALRQ